jgi:alkylated DNA repair dioxygenase AlkB
VLFNNYRDGNYSNDGVQRKNSVVASESFGEARIFEFRMPDDQSVIYTVVLENGSYPLMNGGLQKIWQLIV